MVSNQKLRFKLSSIAMIILISILNNFVVEGAPIYLKTLYNLFVYFSLTKFIYKNSIKYWIFHSLIVWGSGTLLDMGVMSLFPVFLQTVIAKLGVLGAIITTLSLQILHNLIFRINILCKIIKRIWNKVEEIKNMVWIYLVVILLLVIFSILAFSNLEIFTNEIKILLLVLVGIFVSIYFILYIYTEKTYNETSKNLLENNSYFVDLDSKNKIFKHNIIHKLDGIKSVSNDEAKKLIDDLVNEYNLNSSVYKDIGILPNGIDGLILKKIYSNKSKKLDFAINNYVKSEIFGVLTPKKYNILCETLGVCLDNAINAALKSKEKILQIVLLENSDNIFIKLINTFKNELEVDQIGNLNYSTQGSERGIGLYSLFIRKDVKIKTSIINNLFENQIIVRKNKNKV